MNAQLNRLQEEADAWANKKTLNHQQHIVAAANLISGLLDYLQVLEARVTRMEVAGWEAKVKSEPPKRV